MENDSLQVAGVILDASVTFPKGPTTKGIATGCEAVSSASTGILMRVG